MSLVPNQVPIGFFFSDLRKRIEKEKRNNVILCIGAPGTGKSLGSLQIAQTLDPNFSIENVIFEVEELIELLAKDKLGKGDVAIFDEISGSKKAAYSRRAMSSTNMILSWATQTHRSLNYTLILTCPNWAMVDKDVRSLVDFVLDFKRIDFKNKRAMAMIKYVSTNRYTGKIYLKYPRVILTTTAKKKQPTLFWIDKDGVKRYVKNADAKPPVSVKTKVVRIWLNKASEGMVKEYEAKKKRYQLKNYKDYLKILRDGDKKTGKVSFGKQYKKALKKINNYIDAKGKVEPAILAAELDICRSEAYSLAKALQIRYDKPR